MNAYAAEHSMTIRSATEDDLDRVLEIDQLSFPTPWTPHCLKISLKNINQDAPVICREDLLPHGQSPRIREPYW